MGRIKDLNNGGDFQLTDKVGVDRLSPDESFYIEGQSISDVILAEFSTTDKAKQIDKNLAQLIAIADIDENAPENSGKYYDLFDGTNDFSQGILDTSISNLTVTASATDTTITVADGSQFSVNGEITIQDTTNLERKIISNIATNVLTIPALTNGYAIGTPVYRSRVNTENGYAENVVLVDDPTDSKLSPPITLTGNVTALRFSNDGNYLAVGLTATPFLKFYSVSGEVYTEMTEPATIPVTSVQHLDINEDGTRCVITNPTGTFIHFYHRVGDVWTKATDPISSTGSVPNAVTIDGDGEFAIVGTSSSPFIKVFKRTGDDWQKITDLVSSPASSVKGIAVSGDGIYLNCCIETTDPDAIKCYKRSGDVYTAITPPSTQIDFSQECGMSFDGIYFMCGIASATRIALYKRSGDTWTNLSTPAVSNIAVGSINFSSDSKLIFAVVASTPFQWIFSLDTDSDILTLLSDAASLPSATISEGDFFKEGFYTAVGGSASPYIDIYKASTISFLITDMRYNITPVNTIKQVLAWISRNIISGYVLTASVSIVDTSDPESYNVMTKTTLPITGGEEDTFEYLDTTAEEKITLRITLTRTSVNDDAQITKILGAID